MRAYCRDCGAATSWRARRYVRQVDQTCGGCGGPGSRLTRRLDARPGDAGGHDCAGCGRLRYTPGAQPAPWVGCQDLLDERVHDAGTYGCEECAPVPAERRTVQQLAAASGWGQVLPGRYGGERTVFLTGNGTAMRPLPERHLHLAELRARPGWREAEHVPCSLCGTADVLARYTAVDCAEAVAVLIRCDHCRHVRHVADVLPAGAAAETADPVGASRGVLAVSPGGFWS